MFHRFASSLHAALLQRTTGISPRSAPSATPLPPPSPARPPVHAPACNAEICTRSPPGFADTPPYSRNQSTPSPAPSRTGSPRPPRTAAAPTPPPPRPTGAPLGTAAPRAPDGSPPDGAEGTARAVARRDSCSEPALLPYFPVRLKSRHSAASAAANRFNSPGRAGSNPGMAILYPLPLLRTRHQIRIALPEDQTHRHLHRIPAENPLSRCESDPPPPRCGPNTRAGTDTPPRDACTRRY